MKIIITFIIAFVLLFTSACNKKQTWVEENNMKGNIESFTDTTWYVMEKFGEIHKEWIENYTKVNLNKNGQILSMTKYNRNGYIQEKSTYEWKDKYSILNVTYYNEDGDLSSKETYTYNGDKISLVVISDYNDNSEEKLSYEYDGERIIEITGTKKGKTKTITFLYTGENDSYKQIEVDYDGNKTESNSYFDSRSRLVKWLFNGDKYTYQYGKNGLLEKSTYSNFVNTFDYKFDDKGNWIERVEYEKWAQAKPNVKSYITRHIDYRD